MAQRVRKHPHRRHTVPALFDTQHRSVPATSQTDLELLRQSQANPAARGFVMHLQAHIGNQATQRVLMRARQSMPNTVQRTPYLRHGRHMIQRAPDEAAPAAPAATADAPAHDPADWSNFVSSEIQSFLDEFQSIYVVVSPPDADEMVFETVHPPYYLNAVYTENSKKRIEAAETARETAPEYVKSQLFKKDKKGVDQPTALAKGRSQLEDIRKLVQGALDRGLIPASGGKQYPDHKDLRAWLKQYGIGVDCSAFVQQALVRLVQASYAAAGETPDRKGNYGVGSIQSSAVLMDIEKELKKNDRFEAVETPGEARPGDVLTKKGHIRIVMSVENTDDGGVVITFAESRYIRQVSVFIFNLTPCQPYGCLSPSPSQWRGGGEQSETGVRFAKITHIYRIHH
jgi:hypothetical protein